MSLIGNPIMIGSAGINFTVVGGTSQPSTPKENMIWVNTDSEISDWAFSAEEPDTAEGMVWFVTAESSEVAFNAVKKHGIWVYPSSCQQYIGGEWVDKSAKTYQNGEWHDWGRKIYSPGQASSNLFKWIYGSGTATFGSDYLQLEGGGATVVSQNSGEQINLSSYSQIVADVQKMNGDGTLYVWWDKDNDDNPTDAYLYEGVVVRTAAGRETITVPIPSGTGNKYVGISTAGTQVRLYSYELR